MLRYLGRRAASSLLVLFGLSLLVFFLVRAVPGDTTTALLGAHYTKAEAHALRERYGLDKPLPVQYAVWIGRVLRGDLGRTTRGRSVAREIAAGLPVTLELSTLALVFALLFGIPLGILSARRGGPAGEAATAAGLLGISVPNFWLGTMLILLFSLHLGWLPAGGFAPLARGAETNVRHIILPAFALGLAVSAVVLRMTRASMRRVLSEPYLRTARAKGLSERSVLLKHAFRNAFLPVLTILGIQAGYLLGGSVVIEQVFSLPGIGWLALDSMLRRDYPLLQGVILLLGSAFILSNLVVDALYGLVDPRVRES